MRIKIPIKTTRIQTPVVRIISKNAVRKTGAGNQVKGLPASAWWDGFAVGKGPAEREMSLSGIEVIRRKSPKNLSCHHAQQCRMKFDWI
jgi:hypothetical protein